jgi:uncharacterized cupin superfamily protein
MSRPSFIDNYRNHIADDDVTYPGSKELLSIGAPIGHKLGLRKIGLHVATLPPGRRTSWPHAEEKEEEFVFVLDGHPQAWIDGHLHDLAPGDLVAFPAGTGVAHTILNNSEETVRLLVGGEASKEDNRIFYPLHPARNAQCKEKGWFWEDHPEHELGPHDGLTDLLRRDPPDWG